MRELERFSLQVHPCRNEPVQFRCLTLQVGIAELIGAQIEANRQRPTGEGAQCCRRGLRLSGELRTLRPPGPHELRPLRPRLLCELRRRIHHGRIESTADQFGRIDRAQMAGEPRARRVRLHNEARHERDRYDGSKDCKPAPENRNARRPAAARIKKDRLFCHAVHATPAASATEFPAATREGRALSNPTSDSKQRPLAGFLVTLR